MTAAERSKRWRAANPEKVLACKRRWRAANPEKVRAQSKRWRDANPEKVRAYQRVGESKRNRERVRERQAAWRAKNRERLREMKREKVYGLTPDAHAALLARQGGACAICNKRVDPLVIDHCHETGAVRGLLCSTCNIGLGTYNDSPALLRAAADYIERHQQGA